MADPAGALRDCAGVMLFNRAGRVFVGERIDNPGKDAWQMPQGGIEPGESPRAAALRELREEAGIAPDKVELIAQSARQHCYELPPELKGRLWGGRWTGQRQRWFLARFLGEDSGIDIATPEPEFCRWQWVEPQRLPDLIVPFKREIYAALVAEFAPLIAREVRSSEGCPRGG